VDSLVETKLAIFLGKITGLEYVPILGERFEVLLAVARSGGIRHDNDAVADCHRLTRHKTFTQLRDTALALESTRQKLAAASLPIIAYRPK
jgi:hypothetical protein